LEGEDEEVDHIYGSIKGHSGLLVLLACVGYLLFFTCLGGLGCEGDSEAVFGACLSGLPSSGSSWFWLTKAVWYVHLDFWCFGRTQLAGGPVRDQPLTRNACRKVY
jgi:hypothetical protein